MACSNCISGCTKCDPLNVGGNANSLLKNFKLINPIPEEINDVKNLKNFFNKNQYVPYAGYSHDSQHTYLSFIDNLVKMSPTLGGVINSIGFACFGGKTNIKKIVDPDFDLTTESDNIQSDGDLPLKTKQEFLNWIKTFDLGQLDWSSLKNSIYRSYKSNGNSFLIVEIFQSLGTYKVKITPKATRNCLYLNPNLFEGNNVAVSRSWDQKYLKENPPKVYPVYPYFAKDKDQTIKTIFHVKHGDNEFYGRPDWESCIYDSFLEIKNKEYLLAAAHNMFSPKLIIEVESDEVNGTLVDNEDAQKAGFDSAYSRFKYNYEMGSDNSAGTFLARRPKGATPMFVKEVNLNMNEKYYSETDRQTTDKIVLVNGWSRKLLGIEEATGISGNAFIDALKTKMSLIESFQDLVDNQVLNKIIKFVVDQTGKYEFDSIGLESKNPFDHLINSAEPNNPLNNIADAINNNMGSSKK